MPLRKDLWRPAIVGAPAAAILERGSLAGLPWHWLPAEGPFRFTADPFALWREGKLHVFVERFDYRDRRGRIDVLVYDQRLRLLDARPVLSEPWHLSYPFLFEGEGETWMLPEAHRSGRLTLYRAVAFPDRWEAAATISLDRTPIDATVLRHDGRWWLFYCPSTPRPARTGALHVAHAERLRGPWTPHPRNPVRTGSDGSRPGGTVVVGAEHLILPVQDCSFTYGGAIRPLRIATLTPERFEAALGDPLTAPGQAGPFGEGLHTLASAGPVTLVDVKRTELSLYGLGIEAQRRARTLFGLRPAGGKSCAGDEQRPDRRP